MQIRGKLRLCSANHRAGYFSNLACDWLSIVWAYSEQETENGPRSLYSCHAKEMIEAYEMAWIMNSIQQAHKKSDVFPGMQALPITDFVL